MQSASEPENRTNFNDVTGLPPLSTLLSQVLVAFTIEFDNEFERQMPHRTTRHGSTADSHHGPWLVSLVMWSNCMRFVSLDGVSVGKLEGLARTTTNLNGMERWGYVVVEPDPADSRPKPPRCDWVIRATPKGRKAQAVWGPLFGDIEKRWEARFGKDEMDRLRESLRRLISKIDGDLPDCLPILGYGLFSGGPDRERRVASGREDGDGSQFSLSTLLSRALLAFAIEFERESDLSLAISANVMRVLNEQGVRVRDLPLLTGVSKEAISMALGILQKRGDAMIEADLAASRGKVARLTSKGRESKDAFRQLVVSVEQRWQEWFGRDTIRALRKLLEPLAAGRWARRADLATIPWAGAPPRRLASAGTEA